MRDYADQDNFHARIYAMRSRLLSLQQYYSLARNGNELLSDATADISDPVSAKEIIFREQIAPIIPLVETNGKYTPLFLAFLRQFEILNAKLILAKSFGLQVLEQWHDIGPYAVLGRDLLRGSPSLNDIRPLLAGTYLAGVFAGEQSYGRMEIRLDICAARDLYSAADTFTREEKIDFQKVMGKRIAVTSAILWLRLKKNYNWDDEKIRPFLERYYGALGVKGWPQIDARKEMPASGPRGKSAADQEHDLEQYFYNWVSSMFHRDFHSIFSVVAYVWLLFYQIRNLIKIIEGRRFGFSPERIIVGVVCEGKG